VLQSRSRRHFSWWNLGPDFHSAKVVKLTGFIKMKVYELDGEGATLNDEKSRLRAESNCLNILMLPHVNQRMGVHARVGAASVFLFGAASRTVQFLVIFKLQ
jgi:hypothetical protein